MYLSDIFTINLNLAGMPGISVPCGFSSSGLPIGAQILGNFFDEALLLRVSRTLEKALGLTGKKPKI
jgi:aspartyl-tRNA(Asn)/glutamyl-tRNA(Gln) amidotransferase subunit A